MSKNVSKEDFILIEYTGKTESDSVFDTTDSSAAQAHGIFNSRAKYSPVLVVAGKGMVLPGLDEELLKTQLGEEREVTISKEKAFGERNPDMVKLVPLHEFKKHNIDVYPGMPVELDGRRAIVRTVSSGRVNVDFNHPLAGENLSYKFKVVKRFETVDEKIEASIEEFLSLKGISKLKSGELMVTIDKNVAKDANYFVKKSQLVEFLISNIPEVKKVSVVEEYER